jgi:hypothetical protein
VFTALLDACVLWPSLQRDFLLSLAIEGMYRPIWSSAILEELEISENAKLTDRAGMSSGEAELRARHLIEEMRANFEDAERKTVYEEASADVAPTRGRKRAEEFLSRRPMSALEQVEAIVPRFGACSLTLMTWPEHQWTNSGTCPVSAMRVWRPSSPRLTSNPMKEVPPHQSPRRLYVTSAVN